MNRAERRRKERDERTSREATYHVTKAQIEALAMEIMKEKIEKTKEEATADAVNTAMTLLLTLPMEVLMDHFWPKSYAKRIPKFTELVLSYYRKWQDGELDMDKMRADLWEFGGVKLVEKEENV